MSLASAADAPARPVASPVAARPRLSYLGTHALTFEAPGAFDLTVQWRIWAMVEALADRPGVREAVPGVTNLTVFYVEPPADPDAEFAALCALWESGISREIDGRLLTIDVEYGGDGGPHLAEVAELTGLDIAEIVRIHSAPEYIVYAIGSHAGYAYLGGLDARLFVPRRKVPLVSIPGGAVSVAGGQTGVSASTGPSGWHTIGHADTVFFDPRRHPPALLAPGDRIRFVQRGPIGC
ncbi:5-oxoprolinase subunit PxpB [Acuticoccus kandeliae]|uniref:5-oxoprolinase subunit PxpB n=1 Tax=Acuticoccus kandeliae TaxID=2073160 RepID=UPI000D3E3742|nr:5-oxoprolinase subunit PxpB [Acuticoccus kandeliae]